MTSTRDFDLRDEVFRPEDVDDSEAGGATKVALVTQPNLMSVCGSRI